MEEESLYQQLHKLSSINSEEALNEILTTLWKTRRTGLRLPQKSHFQSLLALPSLPDLDPVLACLRSLIRKCVHENFTSDDLLKLFPPDLSLDLQSILILLLQRNQSQWKEEISNEQPLARTSVSYQVKTSVPPPFTSFPSSENSMLIWPHQDDPTGHFNSNDLGTSMSIIAESTPSHFTPFSSQHDVDPIDNLAILPRLKSMTWTLEKSNSAPPHRVAVINLKLQDFAKSPSGEMEVKFQLNRDTLEAMLRSMTYISEQLSVTARTSSGPVQKKQKQ